MSATRSPSGELWSQKRFAVPASTTDVLSVLQRSFTIIWSSLHAITSRFIGHRRPANEEDMREAGRDFGRAVATEVLALVHAKLTEDEISRLATIAQRKLTGAARYLRTKGYSSKVVRAYEESAQSSYRLSLSRWERHLLKGSGGRPAK
jgi:hypothetical protein